MIDVSKVEINEEANEVLITGVNLDDIWCFTDNPEEDAQCKTEQFKFDITVAGQKKYLYLITKSCKKANKFNHMNLRLEALVGEIISISNNFKVR